MHPFQQKDVHSHSRFSAASITITTLATALTIISSTQAMQNSTFEGAMRSSSFKATNNSAQSSSSASDATNKSCTSSISNNRDSLQSADSAKAIGTSAQPISNATPTMTCVKKDNKESKENKKPVEVYPEMKNLTPDEKSIVIQNLVKSIGCSDKDITCIEILVDGCIVYGTIAGEMCFFNPRTKVSNTLATKMYPTSIVRDPDGEFDVEVTTHDYGTVKLSVLD